LVFYNLNGLCEAKKIFNGFLASNVQHLAIPLKRTAIDIDLKSVISIFFSQLNLNLVYRELSIKKVILGMIIKVKKK